MLKHDMIVEAGAYRFSPNKTVIHLGNWTWQIYTPITAHLVMEALKLRTKRYNPEEGQHGLGYHTKRLRWTTK